MRIKIGVFGLILLLVFVSATYAQQYNNEKDFKVTQSGKGVIITDYSGKSRDVNIPPQIKGMPVIGIGDRAFKNKKLTSVVIPDSVITIGYESFTENQLTRVIVPDRTSINDLAFDRKNIVVRQSWVWEQANPQYNNSFDFKWERSGKGVIITNYKINSRSNIVNIPPQIQGMPVIGIGDRAFLQTLLTSVTIPDSVTSIGEGAFARNRLTSVTIPDSVTSIGAKAFMENQLTSVVISNKVTSIEEGTFYSNRLTSVTIPDSVILVGKDAFRRNQITSITIPDSVTSIGEGAFDTTVIFLGVDKETDFKWERSGNGVIITGYTGRNMRIPIPSHIQGMPVIGIGNEAFRGGRADLRNGNIVLIAGHQLFSVTIPNTVTSIGDSAFFGNRLTSITIPDSVKSIGRAAFTHNLLRSITIPDSVTSIGENAFDSNEISSITISKNMNTIQRGVFSSNLLSEVIIPDNVRSIGTGAFYLNEIETITIGANVQLEFILNMGSFDKGFVAYYNAQGKKAGTYINTYNGTKNGQWTAQFR